MSTFLTILAIWLAAQIPLGILLGRFLRRRLSVCSQIDESNSPVVHRGRPALSLHQGGIR